MNGPTDSQIVVRDELGGRVVRITFASPTENELDLVLVGSLRVAIESVAKRREVACVVFDSKFRDFSTGIASLYRTGPFANVFDSLWTETIQAIAGLEVLLICEVDGRCLGAALDLVLTADVVLSSLDAKFGVDALSKLTSELLQRRLARAKANDWLISRKIATAEEAEVAGLVTKCARGWDSLKAVSEKYVDQNIRDRPVEESRRLAKSLRRR